MKLVIITNYYNNFLTYYYNKYPQIRNETYYNQHEHLMNQCFGWSNFYSKALKKHNINSIEIIYNAFSMQQAWAKENNVNGNELNILTQQIKFHKPDILWFQDSFSFDSEYIKSLKKGIKSIRLMIGNCCSPYTEKNLKNLRLFDFTTTCSPVFVPAFEKNRIDTLLLYHAFSSEVLSKIGEQSKQNDIIFIGSLIPRKGFHFERKKFLEEIASNTDIDFLFYGNLLNNNYVEVTKQQLFYVLKEIINKTGTSGLFSKSVKFRKTENLKEFPRFLNLSKALKSKHKGQLFGIDMFTELSKSKLTFDIQGEIGGDYAATMRLFEATGSGLCLLVENKKNIKDLFEIDKEIVTFSSFEEATEKIKWLLKNKLKLLEIGKAAQKRVLKNHTYEHRAKKLVEKINKYLK